MADAGGSRSSLRLVEAAAASPGWVERGCVSVDPLDENPLGHPCRHACDGTRSRHSTVSVIVPAWNCADSLPHLLRSLELSAFNRHAGGRLQVIVCDDGSTDGTAQRVRDLPLDLNVELLSLDHRGQSYSINSGLERAGGDVVVVIDADMVLGCGALDELVSRVERDRASVPFGFRSDLPQADCPPDRGSLWTLIHTEALSRDSRVLFHMPTLVTNVMLATSWTSALDGGRVFVDCEGSVWRRHRFLFGALFAVDRDRFRAIGGMPTALPRWGYQDTLVAARLEADGGYLLPTPAAHGHHLAHEIRHADQWFQYRRNQLGYEHVMSCPVADLPWAVPCASRGSASPVHSRKSAATGLPPAQIRTTAGAELAMGRWQEALQAPDRDLLPAHAVAECLFRLGRLDELTALEPPGFWRALAQYRDGAPSQARRTLAEAAAHDPVAAYVDSASGAELAHLGTLYDSQGLAEVADLHREAASLLAVVPS